MDNQDKDIKQVTEEQIRIARHTQDEIVHDYKGRRYVVNDAYMKDQVDQRQNSTKKEIALSAVRHLLHSDVKELTDRQKDVMIGIMKGKTLRKIAKELDIHFSTVKEHLTVAKEKLERLINQTRSVLKEEHNNE